MTRRNFLLLGLLCALMVGGYLFFSWRYYGLGFPLDDAWIHQTYARNLATLGEWSFLPGQPSAGSTSPLWAGLLAIGYWLGLGPFPWTFLLGWLTLWALALLGMHIFRSLLPDKPAWWLWVGILLAVEWHLVWAAASGMETLLYALFATAILGLLIPAIRVEPPRGAWRWLGIGALVGFSAWVRPEGITLLAPSILVIFLLGVSLSRRLQSVASLIFGFILLFLPYLFFNRSLAGAWWPNTFYAKQVEYAVLRGTPLVQRLLQQFGLPLVGVGVLLLPGFIYFLIRSFRERRWGVLAGGAWVVGHLTMYALRLPVTYQHGRYAIPAMPFYFLLGFAGLVAWVQPDAQERWKGLVSRTWLTSTVVVAVAFLFLGARAYARDVAFIDSEMVATAQWISAHTSPEDLIAAHDIGALGFFSQRQILDLAGLVSPEVIPFLRDESRLAAYLDERGADYLVTFPDWYPTLAAEAELVYVSEGSVSPSLGGENMAVYRWSLP